MLVQQYNVTNWKPKVVTRYTHKSEVNYWVVCRIFSSYLPVCFIISQGEDFHRQQDDMKFQVSLCSNLQRKGIIHR